CRKILTGNGMHLQVKFAKVEYYVCNFGKVYFLGSKFIGKVLFLLAYFIGKVYICRVKIIGKV
ncbi:MAG: hypothetical protein K2J34_04685, partial [Muribaculaceae bacterium]|nr:hypothetical protein [Muribaculaceae bacterium]